MVQCNVHEADMVKSGSAEAPDQHAQRSARSVGAATGAAQALASESASDAVLRYNSLSIVKISLTD